MLSTFLSNNSKVWILDNTGASRIRSIGLYRNRPGIITDLFVGSIARVKPKRKIKRGQIFRAILVQTRNFVFRKIGAYIRSLATRSILIKRNEYMPLSNRVNGFIFYEIKLIREYKFNSLTVYIALFNNGRNNPA
jgi:large subunit ribosomal protein L14